MAERNQYPEGYRPGQSGGSDPYRNQDQYSQSGGQGFQDKWMRGEEDLPDSNEYGGQQRTGGRTVRQFGDSGERYVGGGQGSADDQRFRHQERGHSNPGDSYSNASQQGSGYGQQQQYGGSRDLRYTPDNNDNEYYGHQHNGMQEFRQQHASGDYRHPELRHGGNYQQSGQYGGSQQQGNYGQPGNRGAGHDFNPGGYDRSRDQGSFGGQVQGNSSYGQQGQTGNGRNEHGSYNQSGHLNYGQQQQQSWGQQRGQEGMNPHSGYPSPGSNQQGGWQQSSDRGHGATMPYGQSGSHQQSSPQGFLGGHRGRGPKDYCRSEDRIREDICDRLTDDDHVDASHIQVQVTGNEVILMGTVESREEKRRAEDVVESISGVRHVENRLRVNPRSTGASGYERHIDQHQYTGVSDAPGGIGNESGTTVEIIRNMGTPNNAGIDPNTNATGTGRRSRGEGGSARAARSKDGGATERKVRGDRTPRTDGGNAEREE
ncbi:BON domain-containing protein [Flaviaesturariibacter amylovorans]|uniref:BON domain-containing protein n=1 Tax=Flaviaesturariibacter amylovorans TaxID=1084520 RepID=A0ABP8HB49_9BACT